MDKQKKQKLIKSTIAKAIIEHAKKIPDDYPSRRLKKLVRIAKGKYL